VLTAGAAAFGLAAFAVSWWRWWTYKYETFDLAFYVQGLWLALRGGWHVSLLSVPLLGNHAEPIVYLVLPLFALCPHPMLLVGIQVIALATMPFTGRRIAKALGLPEWPAVALGLATIALPATGYVAIHEFHPEAFSAPLFLLIMEARLAGRLRRYWLWFALALGCKENIALVLALWSLVAAWEDRRLDRARQWQWNVLPGLIAVGWIIGYGGLISPAINGGQVDYGNLYTHLGATGGEMALNCFREPQRVWGALWQGVSGGNLLGGMLLSCAGLVLLRPRWLIIAAPIYLQHLLSARTSEWQIYYHYAAPLIPLFWLGAAEAISRSSRPSRWALAPLAVALTLQLAALIPGDLRVWRDFIKRGEPFALGQSPLLELWREIRAIDQSWWNRSWKAPVVESLARDPSLSVSAGLPYLSHLAERRELYSIHFVFKGLKTLSRRRYEASYTPDAVLIDFADGGTFGKAGGYYHPAGAIEGAPLPSSDELINRFLAREQWTATSWNALLLLRRSPGSALPPAGPPDAVAIHRSAHEYPLAGARSHRRGRALSPPLGHVCARK
jgi:uncharacterized membrane protein